MDAQTWVDLVAIALVLAWFRHLARKYSKIPPKPKQPRQKSGWRLGWRVGPFWFF